MRLRLGLLTLALSALVAAPAAAAPDHTGTLSASSPTFSWDGAIADSAPDLIGFGPGCADPGHKCEDVLLDVKHPGSLKITIESPDGGDITEPSGEACGADEPCGSYQDFDGLVYKSNAAGEPVGEPLTEDCQSTKASEECVLPAVDPGYYLLHVDYFMVLDAGYKGTAVLTTTAQPDPPASEPGATPTPTPTPTPQPGAAPTPTPQSQPAPASKPAAKKKKKAKKASCKSKAKKVKNKKKRAKALKKCKKPKKKKKSKR